MTGSQLIGDAENLNSMPSPDAAALEQCVTFPTGQLTQSQLRAVFGSLPLELTFVDHEDRVRYFTKNDEPIFARSAAVLGRKVQDCHPPKSVSIVNRILSDFRSGRENAACFWLELRGRFVHVEYLAVRNTEGQYIGTLEVVQDITPLRALQGERRLLEYETAS